MRRRRGFSLPELLTAVVIVALLALLVLPLTTELRERTALRSARLELASAFAAARAAAVQKGKRATVTLEGSTISVTVMSGAPPRSVPMLGPLKLDRASGTTVRPLASASTGQCAHGHPVRCPRARDTNVDSHVALRTA